MRPAMDQFELTLDGKPVLRIRPSLRAAFRLHQKHGLDKLYVAILHGNATIIEDIITEGSGDLDASGLYRDVIERRGVRILHEIADALFGFLAASFGLGDSKDTPAAISDGGTHDDIADVLTSYFELGTGWLGWTPAETWAASPSEIIVAHRGLIAKLKAIHGSAEEESPSKPIGPPVLTPDGRDPAFDRAGFDKLRTMGRV